MRQTDAGTCPRCQAWEKEGYPVKSSCNAKPAIRGTASARTPMLFKREPSRMQLLSKYSSAALRAGAVPAMLPFHSRLFRRAHHSTRQARRWVVQNLSKAAIKAIHPRCDLCSPCTPCLLPYWGYQLSTRTYPPAIRHDTAHRQEDPEDGSLVERACEEVLQPTRCSPVSHSCHNITKGPRSEHATGSTQHTEAVGSHRSAQGVQASHSLCSLRSDGDQCRNGGEPRTKALAQARNKLHLSCSLKGCNSCESWQMVPAQEDPCALEQAGDHASEEDASVEPMPDSAPLRLPCPQKPDLEGPHASCTQTASIPIPYPNSRRTKRAPYSGQVSPCRASVVAQPQPGSFDSMTSVMGTEGVSSSYPEPVIYCSPSFMEEETQPGALVASAEGSFGAAASVPGNIAGKPTEQGGGVMLQYHSTSVAHALECAQGISVQLPEVGGHHITASSSDEASPQLVHVLRRSETLQREGSVFQDRESDASDVHTDAEMHPVGIDNSAELPDDAVLDDSWVTVDDVLEDDLPYDSPSPSSFGQSFLRRHVYPTLRKMSPPQS